VNTKATFFAALSECSRLFGSYAKKKIVRGTVVDVIETRPNGRRQTWLKVLLSLPSGTKLVDVLLGNCKAGGPSVSEPTPLLVVMNSPEVGNEVQAEQDTTHQQTQHAEYSPPICPSHWSVSSNCHGSRHELV
jgi:hypothetical protein